MKITDLVMRAVNGVQIVVGYKPSIAKFALDASEIPDEERNATALHSIFYGNSGTLVHKWRNYLAVYDRHLSRFRNTPVRVLEIGVSKGGSLAMWRKYFGPEAVLFGIDIDPKCAAFDGRDASVRIGSQADRKFLASVVAEMGGVDVVIDDGSHIANHQRKSLEFLFPRVSEEGVYICEDLQTSYWRGVYEGGYRRSTAFIELMKGVVDDLHADFHRKGERTARASRCIDGIHFYNSIVVIEKKPQPRPAHISVGTDPLEQSN